ncbi:hypothetical protein ABVK25_002300 [Lepraria finkii]|uniref:Uncharacterized protein n=1 Tax=Lepraria finkii TaxID=1340010 RepID=A0ABR4BHE1_9LECA
MASNEVHTNPSSSNDAGMTANSSRLLLQSQQPGQTAIHHQARSKIHGGRADGSAIGWIKAKTLRSWSIWNPGWKSRIAIVRDIHFWESPEGPGEDWFG